MPGSLTTKTILDGTGASITMRVWDESGAGTGPFSFVSFLSSSSVNANGQALAVNSAPIVPASDWVPGTATGSAVPARAHYEGAIAGNALPTAATIGNLVGMLADKFGRQVVVPVTTRDLVAAQGTTISASTAETTIVTAGGSGVFNDLIALIISNTSASTNTRVDIRDTTGGSVLFSLQSIGGAGPVGIPFMGVPIPQTGANTNWTAQCATSTTDLRIYAVFAKNK